MKTTTAWTILALASIVLTRPASAEEFAHNEMLNWSETAPNSLDPHTLLTYGNTFIKLNLYDTLYRTVDNPPRLIPWLATGHTVSPDGLTWVFTLRHGVKFHSGAEMTADDVVYTFRRLLGLKKAASAPFWPILKPQNVTALDRYRVQFVLDKAYAPFLSALPLAGIVEKKVAEAHTKGNDWAAPWLAQNDAGSGPYRAEPGTFEANQKVQITWFPDYFQPWRPNPVKRVNIHTIKEETTLALALIKGEVDATGSTISADTIDRIKAADNVRVTRDESMRTFQITMNTSRPPFNNIHVRKAISYAFDYDGFINVLRAGTVARNPGPLPENLWGNPKPPYGYKHDLAKAKEEIALAKKDGVDLSRTLTLYGFTGTQDTTLVSQLLQSNLRDIGLKVEYKTAYFGPIAAMTKALDTSPDMWAHWVSAYFIDPENWIGEMYDSQFHGTWKAAAWYKNDKVDTLLRQARATLDQEKRASLYAEASKLIIADAPAVWIYNAVEYRGLSKRIKGFTYTPIGGGSEFRFMTLTK
jgi:peptide/nickel transport system substrate-binding protein